MSITRLVIVAAFAVHVVAQGVARIDPPNLNWPREPESRYSYPSPNATGLGWDLAFSKARRLVEQLTLEEKVSITTGYGFPPEQNTFDKPCQGGIAAIPRVGFEGICYVDSDTGQPASPYFEIYSIDCCLGNRHRYATGFPNGITAASTWNKELIRARGFAIAEEFKVKGVHAVLGPVLESGRTVGGGTNYEGFGNDPYLTGVAAYETVIGHQSAGVQAEAKQYLGYQGQQHNRTYYSSNIPPQALHEVYVWPYAEAVRAGVSCVMTSYPYVNNSQAGQNAYLLNDVLKTHLAFQGYTQTDWSGTKSGVAAILAGMDQDQPGVGSRGELWSYFGANYTRAIQNGTIPESRLTDAAIRTLTPYFWLRQDTDYPRTNILDDPKLPILDAQRQRHRAVAREVAAAGTVLLKNTAEKHKGLPLVKPLSIALFGPAAGQNPFGPNQAAFGTYADPYTVPLSEALGQSEPNIGAAKGTLATGGGTGSTFYPRLVDPISAIQQRAARDLTLVDWTTTTNLTFAAYVAQYGTVCLPVVSSFAGEGTDRNLSLLHNGDALIKTVADNCDNTIPIVQSVGPVDMSTWIDHPNVTAVVWANLGGQELGPALADILYGDVNPSGRLVYTIARNISDYDQQPDIVVSSEQYPQINYTEGVSVDYRGFEKRGVEPLFWFGHGLSYSNFTYQNLSVELHPGLEQAVQMPLQYVGDAPGGDARLYDAAIKVTFEVQNTGPFAGTEIPQLYLELPPVAQNSAKVLRGFTNIHIQNGHTQQVSLYLTRKEISYFSVEQNTWVTPNGEFRVFVGASAKDMRLEGSFSL